MTAPSASFKYTEAVIDEGETVRYVLPSRLLTWWIGNEAIQYDTADGLQIRDVGKDVAVGFTLPYLEAVAHQTIVSNDYNNVTALTKLFAEDRGRRGVYDNRRARHCPKSSFDQQPESQPPGFCERTRLVQRV